MTDLAKFRDYQVTNYDGIVEVGGVTQSLLSMVSENLEMKDQLARSNELLEQRPRDATLASLFCRWLNEHDVKGVWQLCQCELCRDTKAHLNAIGDPCIRTTDGWKPVDGKEEFKTRDVATEMMDKPRLAIDVGRQICDERTGVNLNDEHSSR